MKQLDGEIVELIDDETAVASEIEQADEFKAGLYSATIKVDAILSLSLATPPTSPPTPPPRDLHFLYLALANDTSVQRRSDSMDHILGFFRSGYPCELSDIGNFIYIHLLLEHTACEGISGLFLPSAYYGEAI